MLASCQTTAPITKPQTNNEKIAVNFVSGLQSDNVGVVESAIFQSLVLKTHKPEFDLAPIMKELDRLQKQGQSSEIKFKSYMAIYAMDNPDILKLVDARRFEDGDQYFSQLSMAINKNLFGTVLN